jgi:hypothetical protein
MAGQSNLGNISIMRSREELETQFATRKVDVATCFEVLEHLNARRQSEVMATVSSLLAPAARFIVSVPIEFGFAALPKNVFRWMAQKHLRKELYTAQNIWRSFVGARIPECRDPEGYLSHMGFYPWDIERVFKERFEIVSKTYSPLSGISSAFNSQIFYILKRL